jgi:hypothetical protein
MGKLDRKIPVIPKTLFYKSFSLQYKNLHAYACFEAPTMEPRISVAIALPHQLSLYDSSPFNYEAGIYLAFFIVGFRFQINWM